MIEAKIVLKLPADIVETVRLEEQWENEGGTTSNNILEEWIPASYIPFSPGDCFKVVSGHIEQDGHQIIYNVNIEPVESNQT